MKVKRTIVKTYICDKCKTPYSSAKACRECELRGIEDIIAKIGDRVTVQIGSVCNRDSAHGTFLPVGRIVRISKPQPMDTEYELKWLGGRRSRLKSHVFTYDVAYRCPKCKEQRETRCYAPELVLTRAVKKASSQKNQKPS